MLMTKWSHLHTFLFLTVIFSAAAVTPIAIAGTLAVSDGIFVTLYMWAPGSAALLTKLIHDQTLAGLGWTPRTLPILLFAWLIPIVYALPVYGFAWLSGLAGFDLTAFHADDWPSAVFVMSTMLTAGVLYSLVSALGEEIGWRGFLVPELLKKMDFNATALFSGLIWATWHLPVILLADYSGEGTPVWYSVLCFFFMVIAISYIMAWMNVKTGSLWPAALLHASHNLIVQQIFDGAVRHGPRSAWWTGEFGMGLAITIAVTAFLLTTLSPVRKQPASSKEASQRR